jgi:hypothetical protein
MYRHCIFGLQKESSRINQVWRVWLGMYTDYNMLTTYKADIKFKNFQQCSIYPV